MVYLETALLDGFRFHLDRTAGAFAGADAAALAVVVIEDVGDVVVTGLNHGVVRAHTVAVVALQAVAAGQQRRASNKAFSSVKPC